MSNDKPISPPPRAQADAPIHCAECGTYADRDAVTCAKCGAHLWIKCKHCGTKAVRTASRCAKCKHQLRRDRRWMAMPQWNWWFRHKKRKRLFRALVLAVLVGLIVWAIYESLPEPDRPPSVTATPE